VEEAAVAAGVALVRLVALVRVHVARRMRALPWLELEQELKIARVQPAPMGEAAWAPALPWLWPRAQV
jgi:hypothetical protein